jgi:hypothetical protein
MGIGPLAMYVLKKADLKLYRVVSVSVHDSQHR